MNKPTEDSTAFTAARPGVLLLVASQALYLCCSAIGLTLTGLVGAMLAPSKTWATLPFALVTVVTALSTLAVSKAMAQRGRRPLFRLGAAAGALGGAVAAWAIVTGSFAGFCLASVGMGLFQACAQYYRYAATDLVDAPARPRVIAWVIGGGVLAAVVGPGLAAWARDVWAPHSFAGSYGVVMALASASWVLLGWVDLPRPASNNTAAAPVAWRAIVVLPVFVTAVCNSAVAYAVMMFVMTATPLAALGCGLGVGDAAWVIQWHLVAMFAPSFFSGRLVQRWGVKPVLLTGAALFGAGVCAALSGLSLTQFGLALALNGLGWNFMYVGGSALLTEGFANASMSERAKAQALGEFITFGVVAMASMAAGWAYTRFGWQVVNWSVLPVVGVAVVSSFVSRRPVVSS